MIIKGKHFLLIILVIIIVFTYSCGNRVDTADSNTINATEEITEYATEYWYREPEMAIDNEETALAIGTIMLKNNFDFTNDVELYSFEIEEIDGYWCVYAYTPYEPTTDENGDSWGRVGGGCSVTFRKSDCKIVDIGISD